MRSEPLFHASASIAVLLLLTSCALDGNDEGPCEAGEAPRCDGTTQVFCGQDGFVQRFDCAIEDPPQACRVDAKGRGYCSDPCPPDVDDLGRCAGDRVQRCDGNVYTDFDCLESGKTCGYQQTHDRAACTLPCPPDVDSRGRCEGDRLLRCDGQVFLDADCAKDGQRCVTNSEGIAYCSEPCPPGVDSFGVCENNVARKCDKDTYFEIDCNATGGTCEPVSRLGVGCRGCDEKYLLGMCTPEGRVTACSRLGLTITESCVAWDGSCEYDPAQCQYGCVGTRPSRDCGEEGLTEGQSKCRQNPSTGFLSIVSCREGALKEDECPAASDGSVTCSESNGIARCETSCGPSGRRCTDRGVLAACTSGPSGPLPGWLDCVALEGRCVETDDDAYCACTGLSEAAERCADGRRHACQDGKIVSVECACTVP